MIFKNGQMFYDYGEYDEAIKRFGVIVTKYPDDENAGPAGDRILSALNKAQDYENIESWARKLKKAKSFAAKDQQDRLDRLIVESIQKSGDKYAEAGKYIEAAGFYTRVPKETGDARLRAQALTNAGVMYEKAKQPEKAADVYLDLAEKYGDKSPDVAEKAAFSAGQVYEKVMYYDRAAKAYELVWTRFRTGSKAADALYNAGLLRQALGQNKEAIAHYAEYAKKFRERKDAPDVAFNIGVVYENAGDDGPAYAAFSDYAKIYRSTGKRIVEAYTRAGRTALRLGQLRKAKDDFASAQRIWKAATGKDKKEATAWAAEARYYEGELIFRDYEKVSLDVKPALLARTLKTKGKLLADAEKVYTSVIDYQDLKWATAALFRVGQVYDGFAEALATAASKPPSSLTADQVQAYQDGINAYVVDIQDKAVDALHRRLPEGDPDAGLRRVHREDPRGARPDRRRQVPAREGVAAARADRRSPADPRARHRGGQVTAQGTTAAATPRALRRVGRAAMCTALCALAACGGGSGGGGQRATTPASRTGARAQREPINPRAAKEFEGAMRALRVGGPEAQDTARARLRAATEADPSLWEAWHDLGVIAYKEGDDDAAIDAFAQGAQAEARPHPDACWPAPRPTGAATAAATRAPTTRPRSSPPRRTIPTARTPRRAWRRCCARPASSTTRSRSCATPSGSRAPTSRSTPSSA